MAVCLTIDKTTDKPTYVLDNVELTDVVSCEIGESRETLFEVTIKLAVDELLLLSNDGVISSSVVRTEPNAERCTPLKILKDG